MELPLVSQTWGGLKIYVEKRKEELRAKSDKNTNRKWKSLEAPASHAGTVVAQRFPMPKPCPVGCLRTLGVYVCSWPWPAEAKGGLWCEDPFVDACIFLFVSH